MNTLLTNYGLFIVPLLYMVCFGALAYSLALALKEGADSYAEVYAEEASRKFEDLFLFIPPQRIAVMARTAAVALFLTCLVLFSNLDSPAGFMPGMVAGTFFGGLALITPTVLLRVLKKRRLNRFNIQLVESLVGMSNALKAGFSIMQAFETVVKEGVNPIAQEFNVFLQQTRVGVRFEDALVNLEQRVGSQDLSIMVRSVEIARHTGGNLTEVFEKIAETIRARMQIEGKIDAMTAMGRLQGIVVGIIPIILMVVMTMIDPAMMMSFYKSTAGISILVLVVILEILGFLVIRKIMDIDV